ncbi:MAG: PhnB protein [Eubacteriaceae bacterium]|jgi:PhnB protein|nr:PhnB protein [Eubacteriaceae bacterium]MDK2935754.1 PhnB protein [Eubacteriaceae bacterium]MDK2961620.1 PhnB protein [Eubacteriaceae bacterium]MDN5307687.1 PhnB protein [Eubacteriaceae bacterium]
MVLQPYLSFNRNCQEAVNFYKNIFGTDLPELELFGEMHLRNSNPIQTQNKLPISNEQTKFTYTQLPPKEVKPETDKLTLVIMSDNLNEINCLYAKLQDQGYIETSFTETDWCKAYAVVIDRYGVEWQLNYQEA